MWLQTGPYTHSSLFWLIAVIVIFLVAVIALIVAGSASMRARSAMRAGAANTRGVAGAPGALGMAPEAPKPESFRLLDERYAKGEISREEYMQRQQDLRSGV